MEFFERTPTLEIAGATPFGMKYLEADLAECCFYLTDGLCVYRAAGGTFYFHPMQEREFFYPGQVEPITALSVVDGFYTQQLAILQERNSIIQHLALEVVCIEMFEGNDEPQFTLYSKAVQAFFTVGANTFAAIEAKTVDALLKLEIESNTLAHPYALLLDGDGLPIRVRMTEAGQ